MYNYAKHDECKRYRTSCSNDLKETCSILYEKGIVAQPVLIGSGARNMVTRNGDGPFDLDYNLEIIKADDIYWNNLHLLKDTVRKALNDVVGFYFSDAKDSTSVLTCLLYFNDPPNVKFSFDVAILAKFENGNYSRLVHNKRYYMIGAGQYLWNEVPSSKNVVKKAEYIKSTNKWNKVRERYLELKDMYLSRQDNNHPSFVVYVEAVNEVYEKVKSKNTKVKAKNKSNNISSKVTFNNDIAKMLSDLKQYTGKEISNICSLACKNYDGKKSKDSIRRELVGRYGSTKGNHIYTQIKNKLK